MILVDVNLLLYAVNPGVREHKAAKDWLEDRFSGPERVGLPWATILAFVRLLSSPGVSRKTIPPADVWRGVQDDWLSRSNVWIPEPTASHPKILNALFQNFATSTRKVSDAHLAALAIEHGLTLCSADADFANVPGLQWFNPLRQDTLHERPPIWLSLREQPGRWTGDPLAPAVYARTKTGRPSSRKPRR